MPILQSNQNLIISLRTSSSLLMEYIYYAINTILFIRGFSTFNNFTLQFHYGTPLWILNDEKLSLCFKQTKGLREMIMNRFIRKIILYLRNSTTNEIMECWEFVVEYDVSYYHIDESKRYCLYNIQQEIKYLLQNICSTANCLPVLTRDWKYNITVKLEDRLMSNINTLRIPKAWLTNKNCEEIKNKQELYLNIASKKNEYPN